MIARDAADTIGAALASVAPYVDEIIVLDTGSVDDTIRVAVSAGARVSSMPWVDSFSAAREASYAMAASDWILHLDADDTLEGGEGIRLSCQAAPAAVGGLAWRYVTQRDAAGRVVSEIWRERCTRRGAYRWQGRVHEVLVPRAGALTVPDDAVRVEHHGYRDAKASAKRNVTLGLLDLADGIVPRRRTLWYLMRDTCVLEEWEAAAAYGREYLAVTADAAAAGEDATDVQERYMLLLMLAHCARRGADYVTAIGYDAAALGLLPLVPHSYFGLAQSAWARKRWQEVVHYCDIGRSLHMPPTSVIPGASMELQSGWLVLYAEALAHLGQFRRALDVAAVAAEWRPDDPALAELTRQIEHAAAIARTGEPAELAELGGEPAGAAAAGGAL